MPQTGHSTPGEASSVLENTATGSTFPHLDIHKAQCFHLMNVHKKYSDISLNRSFTTDCSWNKDRLEHPHQTVPHTSFRNLMCTYVSSLDLLEWIDAILGAKITLKFVAMSCQAMFGVFWFFLVIAYYKLNLRFYKTGS